MKFRYKVLIINLILLSVSLGTIGYLMIHRNFALAQNTQLKEAIAENNLLQASVEYELLQVLNSENANIAESLSEIGERVAGGMMATDSSFYIKYGKSYVYAEDDGAGEIDDRLFENLENGAKNYSICNVDARYEIYVTSYSSVDNKTLCVISRRDISEAYDLMQQEIAYFRLLLIVILLVASVIMYLITRFLMHPLEKLNQVSDEIAAGNYQIRTTVATSDEIGQLAEHFNRMAEAVSLHMEELQEMIRRRDQFVADFTHEIKTPMTTIIGYADVMRSMELPREEEIMSLNYIFSEGKRLETMAGKLFELIYYREHPIETKPIHTVDLGREVERIARPAMEKKQQTLVVEMEPAILSGAQELLVTVLINLLDNARKASEPGQSVYLTGAVVRQEESGTPTGYHILVEDHGIGMAPEEVQKICDEFYMVDKSRARKEGGAGLGMSLVSLIVKRHGATLTIDSCPGKGTRMQITFPSAQMEEV